MTAASALVQSGSVSEDDRQAIVVRQQVLVAQLKAIAEQMNSRSFERALVAGARPRPGFACFLVNHGWRCPGHCGRAVGIPRPLQLLIGGRPYPAVLLAHSQQGHALGALGRYEELASSFSAALRIDPDNLNMRYSRGCVLVGCGRAELSLDDLNYAVSRSPATFAEAWTTRARALFALGRHEEALVDVLITHSASVRMISLA